MSETNAHGLRVREAFRTAERLIDAELGPSYEAGAVQQAALQAFYAYDDDECRDRTYVLIMALTEYAARAIDRVVTAEKAQAAEVA